MSTPVSVLKDIQQVDRDRVRFLAERCKEHEVDNDTVDMYIRSAVSEVHDMTGIYDWNVNDIQLDIAKDARNHLAAESVLTSAFKDRFTQAASLRVIGLDKIKVIIRSPGRVIGGGDNPIQRVIVSDPKIPKLNPNKQPYMSTFD